jgi:hypothetical protein
MLLKLLIFMRIAYIIPLKIQVNRRYPVYLDLFMRTES